MLPKNVWFLIFLGLLGCSNMVKVPESGVQSITVHEYKFVRDTKTDADSFVISNSGQIRKLLRLINSSRKELVKFFPSHQLRIQYRDTIRTVVISNDLCKIDGVSYRMRNSANNYLKN